MTAISVSDGCATGAVRTWLRLEGLTVLSLSLILYGHFQFNWWLFLALLLVPDLSMVPYLMNPKAGAVSYNVVHSYLLPLALGFLAIAAGKSGMLPYLLIWTAHIGMDRAVGYGLKYSTAFGNTHLGLLNDRDSRRKR
jgi:hypothetical protein